MSVIKILRLAHRRKCMVYTRFLWVTSVLKPMQGVILVIYSKAIVKEF